MGHVARADLAAAHSSVAARPSVRRPRSAAQGSGDTAVRHWFAEAMSRLPGFPLHPDAVRAGRWVFVRDGHLCINRDAIDATSLLKLQVWAIGLRLGGCAEIGIDLGRCFGLMEFLP